MQDLETLEGIGSLGLSTSDVEDGIDEFRAFGVVSFGPVVSGTALSLLIVRRVSI